MRRSILLFALFSFWLVATGQVKKEEVPQKPLTRILFVFDGSQSMFGKWQTGMKMDIAKKLMAETLDSLKDVKNLQLALRLYGHQKKLPPQDCNDTKLEVPFAFGNVQKIKNKINSITPSGTTPIAASLEAAGGDFPPCKDCRNIIILITDGIEECDGDPCAVSLALQKKGIVLKPFVIGVGLDMEFKKTFECVGTYFDASNEKNFKTILNVVITQALNSTTAQVNLLDSDGKPTETNVNMTFYDNFTGAIKYNLVHTLNSRGVPDTLVIDPLPNYKVVVHTIPPVKKDSVKLNPGKHTIVAVDAPQGILNLRVDIRNDYKSTIKAIVRKSGEMGTLNIQDFNKTEKYITGKYDLEILTLPRTYIKDVEIKQSYTTTVQVPQPGLVTFSLQSLGYTSVYTEEDNKLKFVCNLEENLTNQTLVLQPGRYRVVFRAKSVRESAYTIEKSFKVEAGSSIQVKPY